MRIHAIYRDAVEESEFGLMSDFLIGRGRQEIVWQRVPKRDTARCECTRLTGVAGIKIKVLVEEIAVIGSVVPEILIWFGEFPQREARADHGLSGARYSIQKPLLKLRVPGKADCRLRANVPWRVLMAARGYDRVHSAL